MAVDRRAGRRLRHGDDGRGRLHRPHRHGGASCRGTGAARGADLARRPGRRDPGRGGRDPRHHHRARPRARLPAGRGARRDRRRSPPRSLRAEPVVAFNASFDLTLLDAELRRHGCPPCRERIGRQVRVVLDPLVLDRTSTGTGGASARWATCARTTAWSRTPPCTRPTSTSRRPSTCCAPWPRFPAPRGDRPATTLHDRAGRRAPAVGRELQRVARHRRG